MTPRVVAVDDILQVVANFLLDAGLVFRQSGVHGMVGDDPADGGFGGSPQGFLRPCRSGKAHSVNVHDPMDNGLDVDEVFVPMSMRDSWGTRHYSHWPLP